MTDRSHKRKLSNERYAQRWLDDIGPTNRPTAQRFLALKQNSAASATRINYARALAAFDAHLDGRPWTQAGATRNELIETVQVSLRYAFDGAGARRP